MRFVPGISLVFIGILGMMFIAEYAEDGTPYKLGTAAALFLTWGPFLLMDGENK